MESNRLSLNCDKTEVVWCATSRRQHQLLCSALSVDGTLVNPVRSARDLGIYIDADLVMRTHVQRTVSRCFAVLCQLRQISHSVPTDTFQTLVVSLVLTRLDFMAIVLCGWPFGLLGPTTPVSAERGRAVDLSPAAIRPHPRRAGLPPLAARP